MHEQDPILTLLILSPVPNYPSIVLFESTAIRPNIPFLRATVSNIPIRDSEQLILTRSLLQRVENMATTRAKQIIQAPLPPLNVGTYRTTSSALHNLKYIGTLSPWPNFKSSVQAIYNAQVFSRSSTAAVSPSLHNIDPKIVCVRDEHSL